MLFALSVFHKLNIKLIVSSIGTIGACKETEGEKKHGM